MTTTFHNVKKSEISCCLVKKLQFEAQTQHTTDSAEGVDADKADIEVDEEGEDLDGLEKWKWRTRLNQTYCTRVSWKLRQKQRQKMKMERNPTG